MSQGNPLCASRLADSLTTQLADYARHSQDLWLLDADLGDSYGLTTEVTDAFGSRFIQAGIAEQCMVSMASGLAAMGKQPWVFSFAAFLLSRGYDQIRCGISQMSLHVTLVGANAGICGIKNGNTHLCLNDVSLLSCLPGIDIWSPCSAVDLYYSVEQIMQRKRAAYLRLPKFASAIPETMSADYQLLTETGDILLLSTGGACDWAQELVAALKLQGLACRHIHVTRIQPLPTALGAIMARGYQGIYSLEDHFCEGGFGDMLARHYPQLTIHKIGWPLNWLPASQSIDHLRRQCAIDTTSLTQWILEEIKTCNKHTL